MVDNSWAPAFVVVARRPGDNALVGLVEHSFAMDWKSDDVRVWWSGKAYSILGEHYLSGEQDALYNRDEYRKQHPDWDVEMYDVADETSPIEVDVERWIKCMNGNGSKYCKRNAPFKMRELAEAKVETTVDGG